MEKMRKRTKGLYIFLSLLFAVLLWVYVGNTVNPDQVTTLRNVPVTFTGLDTLEERGLMISVGNDQTVTLSLQAKRSVVSQLSNSSVSVVIDVSQITDTGERTQPDYQITFPRAVSNETITVRSRTPDTIQYTISKRVSREIEVRTSFTGSIASGFQTGTPTTSPGFITVSGREELVNQIDYARVVVSQENLAETYTGQLPFTLINYDGDTIDASTLELSNDLVLVTLPVGIIKEVELTVNLIEGGGATLGDATVEIEPRTIMVSGSETDLEALKEISLGDIELSNVLGTDTFTRTIELTDALTNVSGVTEAKITVQISGLTTRTIDVDNIELINVPEEYGEVSKVTLTRSINVRGKEGVVEQIVASQLRIVADLSGLELATGTQSVPVTVYLDGTSEVGVVGNDYTIVISVTK